MGMTPMKAAEYAGSKNPNAYVQNTFKSDKWLMGEWERIQQERLKRAKITREVVEDIVLEAVDIARIQAMPGEMIRGASELNKMCGFYTPEKVDVKIEATLKRVQTEFESLTDEELIQLMGDRLDPIEAEFRRLEADE